jgi:hypothetical protein
VQPLMDRVEEIHQRLVDSTNSPEAEEASEGRPEASLTPSAGSRRPTHRFQNGRTMVWLSLFGVRPGISTMQWTHCGVRQKETTTLFSGSGWEWLCE